MTAAFIKTAEQFVIFQTQHLDAHKQALQRQLEIKATYVPDENHTATYRRAYDKRENLLKALNGTL